LAKKSLKIVLLPGRKIVCSHKSHKVEGRKS
jgi:hypothetical protein